VYRPYEKKFDLRKASADALPCARSVLLTFDDSWQRLPRRSHLPRPLLLPQWEMEEGVEELT